MRRKRMFRALLQSSSRRFAVHLGRAASRLIAQKLRLPVSWIILDTRWKHGTIVGTPTGSFLDVWSKCRKVPFLFLRYAKFPDRNLRAPHGGSKKCGKLSFLLTESSGGTIV